jgi:NHL repeat
MGQGKVRGARGAVVSAGRSRLASRSLTTLLTVLATLLVYSASAQALVQQGHEFGTAFGTSGANALAKSRSALAVNSETGNIYVADSANNRVVVFNAAHEFLETWGFGVGGGAGFEICKQAEEAKCKAGLPGTKPEQFESPTGIAVDNAAGSHSKGDVYVVANPTWSKSVVYKFNHEGRLIDSLVGDPNNPNRPTEKQSVKEQREEFEGPIDGVAVALNGDVFIEREALEESYGVERFNDEEQNAWLERTELEIPSVVGESVTRPGFAIDAAGNFYITYEPGGEARAEEEEELKEKERTTLTEPCVATACLVAQVRMIDGRVLAEPGSQNEPEATISEVNEGGSSGLAVDGSGGAQLSGTVYVDNQSSIATLTSSASLVQTLTSPALQEHAGGSGLAVNVKTHEVLVADSATGMIETFPVAKPASEAVVEDGSLAASDVTAVSATLRARIDPGGIDTRFRFRYCTGNPAACAEAPEPPATGEDLGAGFGDVSASLQLSGLLPSSKYTFVVVTERGSPLVRVESVEEGTFTTPAASAAEAGLPDGRSWELVTPPAKHAAAVEASSDSGGTIQASSNGAAITYVASANAGEGEPQGNEAPEVSQLISRRSGPGAWKTQDLALAAPGSEGFIANEFLQYRFFSADLSLSAVFPLVTNENRPKSLDLRDNTCVGTEACLTPIVIAPTATLAGSAFQTATPDLQHVVVRANPSTIAEPAVAATIPELYERSGGHFTLVSTLPEGKGPATGGVDAGSLQSNIGVRHALSDDGSRVVWANKPSQEAVTHVYDSTVEPGVADAKTTQIDVPEAGLTPTILAQPLFQTASSNGSRVFFTDDQRLTSNASSPNKENPRSLASKDAEVTGDLYVYEPEKPAGEQLTDLTPDTNPGETGEGEEAAVQGGVIGASENGAYVYFVANGALAPGAKAGQCRFEGLHSAGCNLYVVHNNGGEWEPPKFIARLSNEDAGDWGQEEPNRLNYGLWNMTARVSPNGRYLAFMSDQRLTSYNNTDAHSGVPDEEVYLYDAESEETEQLKCASCNPSGAAPDGVFDTEDAGEGEGLLVDRSSIWSLNNGFSNYAHWLAGSVPAWDHITKTAGTWHQPNYLTNEGRLFFNSPDALVKQAANGKEDVYEYEPTGIGSCQSDNTKGGCVALISSGTSHQESAFMDASANGADAFFVSSASLSPLDTDTAFDIYDARVCSGPEATEPCAPEPSSTQVHECEEEACRPPAQAPPAPVAPASTSTGASGNLTPANSSVLPSKEKAKPKLTRAQQLAKALKACKKDKKKAKRLACEKQARKKFAPAKKAAKKAKKSSSGRGR